MQGRGAAISDRPQDALQLTFSAVRRKTNFR